MSTAERIWTCNQCGSEMNDAESDEHECEPTSTKELIDQHAIEELKRNNTGEDGRPMRTEAFDLARMMLRSDSAVEIKDLHFTADSLLAEVSFRGQLYAINIRPKYEWS